MFERLGKSLTSGSLRLVQWDSRLAHRAEEIVAAFATVIPVRPSTQTTPYWYDPTGKQSVGVLASVSAGIPQVHHQFAGYYNDTTGTNQGFYKVGLRYPDTTLGRWTQQDPKSRITNPAQPPEASP